MVGARKTVSWIAGSNAEFSRTTMSVRWDDGHCWGYRPYRTTSVRIGDDKTRVRRPYPPAFASAASRIAVSVVTGVIASGSILISIRLGTLAAKARSKAGWN